ncbi:MAG: hypothetical protein GY749_25770 [Desulfobacteraceae bacterium]|nr:hypothetical protein [Desulfobacteraceae bacterium]
MEFRFSEWELKELETAWKKLKETQLLGTRASGEHYLIVSLLKSFGCRDRFESSSQVENYVEYVLEHGVSPEIY